MPIRARGGRVKDGPAWKEGLNAGTQVQHSDGKSDGKDINRGKVITYRDGGKVGNQTSGTAGAAEQYRDTYKRVKPHVAGIERATGGKVEAPKGVDPSTRLPGGAGGGEARLTKEQRARRGYKAA